MDPSTIATTAVACLTPYLVEGGKAAAKKVGGAVGEKVMKLYDTLKAKLIHTPACEALADLESAPKDADLQATMRVQLKKTLEANAPLRDELAALLQDIAPSNAGIRQEANITGDQNITPQIAGDSNTITIGAPGKTS
jgi:hypothetical protein